MTLSEARDQLTIHNPKMVPLAFTAGAATPPDRDSSHLRVARGTAIRCHASWATLTSLPSIACRIISLELDRRAQVSLPNTLGGSLTSTQLNILTIDDVFIDNQHGYYWYSTNRTEENG